MRYRLGVWLLFPWLKAHMQEQNRLASVYATREKALDAMSQRTVYANLLNGSARLKPRRPYPQVDAAD